MSNVTERWVSSLISEGGGEACVAPSDLRSGLVTEPLHSVPVLIHMNWVSITYD